MMSNPVGEFKDITIEKVFKPVPSFDKADIYYLPILLTDIPPKEWLEAFHSAYDSCQKYEGEQILPHHQIPVERGLSADVSVGKRDLTFNVNAGGKVCHQGGVIVYQLMPKEEAG